MLEFSVPAHGTDTFNVVLLRRPHLASHGLPLPYPDSLYTICVTVHSPTQILMETLVSTGRPRPLIIKGLSRFLRSVRSSDMKET